MNYNDNISKGLPDRVKDFYLGNTNVIFKTIKNQYFSAICLKELEHWRSYFGNKSNYQLVYVSHTDEKRKFEKLEIFNDFPMEIKNIFEFDVCIIQGNRPFTKEIEKKLDHTIKKYTKEKEELSSQVLYCKRCNCKYFEFQNKNDSRKFHLTNKTHEIKYFDTEMDVYD